MIKRIILLAVFCVIGWTSLAVAQTLTVDANTMYFSSPTKDDFDAGSIEALNATRVTVTSDTTWTVSVKTDSVNMGGYGKPLSDFQFKKNGAGSYLTISSTDQTLDSGSAGTFDIYVDYKTLLSWAQDAPNTYSLVVTYTLTTP